MLNFLFYVCLLAAIACNNGNSTPGNTAKNIESSTLKFPYVTAKINGIAWQSIPDEIMTTYNNFDDKVNIFTQDDKGKMNFLITLEAFSKTGVGSYNSVKDNAGGYGISLLDEDKQDNIENDYDNFHQGAVANCITVTSIKEVTEGKIVTGYFASPMNVSNNYIANKDKEVQVTEGKFAVLVKK